MYSLKQRWLVQYNFVVVIAGFIFMWFSPPLLLKVNNKIFTSLAESYTNTKVVYHALWRWVESLRKSGALSGLAGRQMAEVVDMCSLEVNSGKENGAGEGISPPQITPFPGNVLPFPSPATRSLSAKDS